MRSPFLGSFGFTALISCFYNWRQTLALGLIECLEIIHCVMFWNGVDSIACHCEDHNRLLLYIRDWFVFYEFKRLDTGHYIPAIYTLGHAFGRVGLHAILYFGQFLHLL